MNHYPHHLGDYAKDTLGFSMQDHGAYRLLMDAYYASEEPLPAEDVYAIAKATSPAERKSVDKVLRKFRLKGEVYHHKRIDEEIAAFRSRSDQATKNIRKRWGTDTEQDTKRDTERDTKSGGPVLLASSHKPVTTPPKQAATGDRDIPADAHTAALAALRDEVQRDGRITLPAKGLMHLAQWAKEGLTPTQIAQAIALARQRKVHPELIPFAYLVPIVEDVKAGRAIDPEEPRGKAAIGEALARIKAREEREAAEAAAASRARANGPESSTGLSTAADEDRGVLAVVEEEFMERPWWRDDEGFLAAGEEASVVAIEGESFDDYKARVMAARGHGPWLEEQDAAMLARVQRFVALGVNPPGTDITAHSAQLADGRVIQVRVR